MKFRKKPVVIEATQWFESVNHPALVSERGYKFPYIHTLEGRMWVAEGDWIITGVKGEFYPCKPDIFEMTYDPVDEIDPYLNTK